MSESGANVNEFIGSTGDDEIADGVQNSEGQSL